MFGFMWCFVYPRQAFSQWSTIFNPLILTEIHICFNKGRSYRAREASSNRRLETRKRILAAEAVFLDPLTTWSRAELKISKPGAALVL